MSSYTDLTPRGHLRSRPRARCGYPRRAAQTELVWQ